MPSMTFSQPRSRTRKSPRFDLSKLGPGARAQLEAQGFTLGPVKGVGRYRKAAEAERTVDGRVFDSGLEARAFVELKRQLPITAIELQPEFELQPAFRDETGRHHRAIYYVADFRLRLPDGEHVVDIKGHLTEVFRLKEKLFRFRYRKPLHKIYTVEQMREFLKAHGVLLRN